MSPPDLDRSQVVTAFLFCACIDGENCDLANSQTSYFPELKLHYSYAACASENTFSSDATLIEDAGEGTRKKLKEIIATTLIEEITGMPTHDTDMQLLSTLGKINTWDHEQVRQGIYVQGKHMLHNAEKGGYGKKYTTRMVHLLLISQFALRSDFCRSFRVLAHR